MRGFSIALLPAILLTGCAYVGEPLPPALNIPKRATALMIEQVGPRVEARFTLPEETTEQLPVDIRAIEFRAGAVDPGAWPGDAQTLPVSRGELLSASASGPATPWVGKRIVAGVRVQSRQGKWSEWSILAPLDVVEPLATPASVTATAVPQGVRIAWKMPARRGAVVRIEKRAPSGRLDEVAVVESGNEWIDSSARFGEAHAYRATAALGTAARSESVELAPFTPVDTFAPAVPSGLAAAPGLGSIELSWDRPSDPDLAGFRLYREPALPGAASPPELIVAASASDRQIKAGATYRYSVSSVDRIGNESARSASVEVIAPN